MNERIEDLLYHSGLTASGCWEKFDDYDKDALNKFAELIVRECITVYERDPSYYHEVNIERIQQHFGIQP